ncbi:unnamed protein product [Caenorhabditis angaria]|uniref:C-type lectin domain-containing protein n=1 Tax=Caenorhabditis angaria TaxID=860376 RepID=A0A9P1IMH5_9PELO|nr:unnamed protein product [Caenorhabditis angaria]
MKFLLIFLSFSICQACLDNDVEINGRCFRFIEDYVSWTNASERCWSQDLYFASVRSNYEARMIGEAALQKFSVDPNYFWIGLRNTSIGFEWDDYAPLDYFNWAPNFPDSFPYVASSTYNYKWVTTPGEEVLPYVCEYFEATTVAYPQTTITKKSGGCLENDLILGNRCYYFNRDQLLRSEAEKICENQGKTLAIFDTLSQIAHISSYAQSQFGTTYTSFWIGLLRSSSTSPFYWQDGTSAVVTNWSPGYPYGGQLYVGQDIANTKWRTFNLDDVLFSVCSGVL